MQVDVKILDNGTRWFVHNNGTTMHECQFCGTWYVPNRRFMQKFCRESCRVMACRERKKGLYGVSGGNLNSRNKTTNTELYNQIEEMRNELSEYRKESSKLDIKAKEQLEKIKSTQNWHIFLTCTIPLIAPTLSKSISNLFAKDGNADNLQEFTKKVEPLLDKAPPELKEQIINVATNFFNSEDMAKNFI